MRKDLGAAMTMKVVGILLGVVLLWGLQGCVSDPGPRVAGPGLCSDKGLDWAIGQEANEANMKRLSAESGAGLVNPIGPASVVRKDSRNDRLRVFLDKDNRIVAARCE